MTTIQSGATTPISSSLLATMNPQAATSTGSISADENKFLTLLVSQLKNQDPTNPLDNAQITSQLAQLSTVTGINQLNTTLGTLASSFQSSQLLQATNLIGHSVLTAGNSMTLANGSAVLGVSLGTAADDVQVTVKNAAGVAVNTIDLGAKAAGTVPLTWDGKDDAGNQLAGGAYTFSVVAKQAGVALPDAIALASGTVGSVSTNAQGVKLNVSGVGAVSLADIQQIL